MERKQNCSSGNGPLKIRNVGRIIGVLAILSIGSLQTSIAQYHVDGFHEIDGNEPGFSGFLDPSDYYGWSLASIGDIDKGGVQELAIGAYGLGTHGTIFILVEQPKFDLSITKTNDVSSSMIGNQVSYTITLTNNGTYAIIGATMSDSFDQL